MRRFPYIGRLAIARKRVTAVKTQSREFSFTTPNKKNQIGSTTRANQQELPVSESHGGSDYGTIKLCPTTAFTICGSHRSENRPPRKMGVSLQLCLSSILASPILSHHNSNRSTRRLLALRRPERFSSANSTSRPWQPNDSAAHIGVFSRSNIPFKHCQGYTQDSNLIFESSSGAYSLIQYPKNSASIIDQILSAPRSSLLVSTFRVGSHYDAFAFSANHVRDHLYAPFLTGNDFCAQCEPIADGTGQGST